MQNIVINEKVVISCPSYYNGKKFTGVIKSVVNDISVMVIIDGNKKATKIAKCWVKIITPI